jgi:hypothetical protein
MRTDRGQAAGSGVQEPHGRYRVAPPGYASYGTVERNECGNGDHENAHASLCQAPCEVRGGSLHV